MKHQHLSTTYAALADPTRRAILARLAAGEASVTELAEPFQMSLPAVSKHLKVLERAGLIVRSRERQWRPARLEAGPLKEVAVWTERYRRFWEESYDRLDRYLDELRGRDGEVPGFRGEFREIVRPERIVWTFEWEGMPGHVSVDTLVLEEQDGKTTLTARSVFDSVEDRDGMLQSGM